MALFQKSQSLAPTFAIETPLFDRDIGFLHPKFNTVTKIAAKCSKTEN